MAAADIAFESHGLTHAILTAVSEERVESELRQSLDKLRQRGHARNRLLAYPGGAWSPAVARMAARANYRAAFTTCRAFVDRHCAHLQLPRLSLHEDVSSSRGEFLRLVPGSGLQ